MNRIKQLRQEQKKTQHEICAALGITVKTLYLYERGSPVPSDKLIALARFFKTTADYILGIDNVITVTKDEEVMAIITGTKVIEYDGVKVIFSDN